MPLGHMKCNYCASQYGKNGLEAGDWWFLQKRDGLYYGYEPMKKWVVKTFSHKVRSAKLIGATPQQ